jgi:hypothetical protein
MKTINSQPVHIAQIVRAFISAASTLSVVAGFRNAGINLGIADEVLICRINPKSA